jgi:cytochrome d ubiquinol oxidase subunit II
MDLPLLSACFAAFAITLYVLLDGFDLGVGVLLLFQKSDVARNHMIDSITPTWDGNETWLVMAGITLFTAFPIAYGIIMPAFYIPIIVMLLSLGLRGVSFEFRVQMKKLKHRWDFVFGVASLIASLMQGLIVGGLLQGVQIEGQRFSGHVTDVFHTLPLVTSVALVFGYAVLGSGWLIFKANIVIQKFARGCIRVASISLTVLFCVGCAYAASVQPGVHSAWIVHAIPLSAILILFILVGGGVATGTSFGVSVLPFTFGLLLFLLGISGLSLIFFPNIIPFRMSLWDAASSPASQRFLLTGASLVTPMVLAYSAFAYWVFRGRTPEKGWEQ